MSYVHNFPVGSYVQIDCRMGQRDEPGAERSPESVGTVVGLTVNSLGEPILMIHMIMRKVGMSSKDMESLGWRPLSSDSTQTFWERTGPMHPANVRILDRYASLR
jgi:hypothetical protein